MFTASQLAKKAKQTTQMEFLYQNGAEGSGQFPATTSIRLVSTHPKQTLWKVINLLLKARDK